MTPPDFDPWWHLVAGPALAIALGVLVVLVARILGRREDRIAREMRALGRALRVENVRERAAVERALFGEAEGKADEAEGEQ